MGSSQDKSTPTALGHEADNQSPYGVRITIPDGPLGEQLEMTKSMREVMLTFAKVAGEEDTADFSQFDEVIAKIEALIAVHGEEAVIDLEPKDE